MSLNVAGIIAAYADTRYLTYSVTPVIRAVHPEWDVVIGQKRIGLVIPLGAVMTEKSLLLILQNTFKQ